MIEWITPLAEPEEVRSQGSILYSTRPHEVVADDGHSYIIKGPDPKIVFSEHAAYALARRVGVPVPSSALCMLPGSGAVYFASRKMPNRMPVEAMTPENPEMLAATAAMDIWIANDDRNLGNIVAGKGTTPGGLLWYAIDFEKSRALRGESFLSLSARPPKGMLPREGLGVMCRSLPAPLEVCSCISGLGTELEPLVDEWNRDISLPRIDWGERSALTLKKRGERIRELVSEAWS